MKAGSFVKALLEETTIQSGALPVSSSSFSNRPRIAQKTLRLTHLGLQRRWLAAESHGSGAPTFLWVPDLPSRELKQGGNNIVYGVGPLSVIKANATTVTSARDGSKNVRAEVSSAGAVTAAFRYRAYGLLAQSTNAGPSYLGLPANSSIHLVCTTCVLAGMTRGRCAYRRPRPSAPDARECPRNDHRSPVTIRYSRR